MKLNLTLNGTARSADVPERTLLADLLRDTFGMTGTHVGCDT
ncbi:MAG: (2Fe-2S)-binding protein, partial [Betaproteobacteria bacterium]|nr:(2Fe-2S)-binding protein [Betaproteobacteria bacterium]